MTSITTKFNELRLRGMSRSWEALVETRQHQKPSLSEGLEILLQEEKLDRAQRRFERLKKNAKLRYQSSSYDFSTGRTIYTGPPGGKYYINSNGNKTYVQDDNPFDFD